MTERPIHEWAGLVAYHGQALLTIKEAMWQTRTSRRTIYNWLRRGRVQYVRTAGGPIRIVSATLWRAPTP